MTNTIRFLLDEIIAMAEMAKHELATSGHAGAEFHGALDAIRTFQIEIRDELEHPGTYGTA